MATEPTLDWMGDPVFLVDIAGRSGMSGSPAVIALPDGNGTFAGVYSGRVLGPKENSELGYVWKLTCLDEILNSGLPGKSSHLKMDEE